MNPARALFILLLVTVTSTWVGLAQSTQLPVTPWPIGPGHEPIYAFTYSADYARSNYTPSDAVAAQSIWQAMDTAAARGGASDWGGEYFCNSNALDFRILRVEPGVGFVVLDVYTCVSSPRRMNFGTAVESATDIRIEPSLTTGTFKDVRRLVKVKWGPSRYLIPEQEMADFCDFAAGRGSFNRQYDLDLEWNVVFLCQGDLAPDVDSMPVVPAEFQSMVKEPIVATVTAVGKTRTHNHVEWAGSHSTQVVLSAGSRAGVRVGMYFTLPGKDMFPIQARVMTVGSNSCTALVLHYLEPGDSALKSLVYRGLRVWTSPAGGTAANKRLNRSARSGD